MKTPRLLATLTLLASAAFLHAAIELPAMFSDHMVLQRGIPVPVWGTATPGEEVKVTFGGQSKTAVAGPDGKWKVLLDPLQASSEPGVLAVSSPGSAWKAEDVLVGDVWVASGQSNMGSPMSSGSAAKALPEANDPLLRLFNVTKIVAAAPLDNVKGSWQPSSPESAKDFSAVAWFFAREIRKSQNVPVGVFNASWGGTPIKTWMSLDSLRKDPPIAKTLAEWEAALAKHESVKDSPQRMEEYLKDMKDWETTVQPAYKAALAAHNAEMDAARAAGQPPKPAPTPSRPEPQAPDPIAMPSASKRPATPTISFNGMIAPLIPYGLKGVIWYQGEADGSRGPEYREWFPRLIEGWRQAWAQGDFPFLYVQIPGNGKDPSPVATQGMPFTREAQAMALRLPATGMAVTIDIGDPKEVHPDNKSYTGERLALVGRKVAYAENIVASGPVYDSFAVDGNTVKVKFRETGGGLVIGEAPWVAPGVSPLAKESLKGFFVAGEDKKWVEANATIDGDTVLVSSPQVERPVAVRYAWANSPRANLYNAEGLPAGPFRTDSW